MLYPPPVYTHNGIIIDEYQNIVDFWETYGVDAVFVGHAHAFGTSFVNSIHYYLIGGGGNDSSKSLGFTRVDVDSSAIKVYMEWMNGTIQNIGFFSA